MKVIIFALLANLAIGGVFGDEKGDAIKEIKMKYDELFNYAHGVTKHIQAEMEKADQSKLDETKEYVEKLKTNTLEQFAAEVKRVSRTAVVKGKPLSTFDCLATTSLDGRGQILKTHQEFLVQVDKVVSERKRRLEYSLISAGLMLNAVTELKDQAVKSITEAKTGIKSLKEEALKRIDNGKNLFVNLETSIQKPTLTEEYNTLKTNTENKLKDLKDSLYRRLQKCLF